MSKETPAFKQNQISFPRSQNCNTYKRLSLCLQNHFKFIEVTEMSKLFMSKLVESLVLKQSEIRP